MAPDEILHLLPQIYHFFPVWIPIQKNTEYRPVRIQIGSISIIQSNPDLHGQICTDSVTKSNLHCLNCKKCTVSI